MNKNFIKSVTAGVLTLALASSCSAFKAKEAAQGCKSSLVEKTETHACKAVKTGESHSCKTVKTGESHSCKAAK